MNDGAPNPPNDRPRAKGTAGHQPELDDEDDELDNPGEEATDASEPRYAGNETSAAQTAPPLSVADLIKIAADRKQLAANGYPPVALLSHTDPDRKRAGKKPFKRHWVIEARQGPPEDARYSRALEIATNTGIATHNKRAIDIDCGDPDRADAIAALAEKHCGKTIVRFRRNSARRAFLYRAAEGEPRKIPLTGTTYSDSDEPDRIEVLGAGQQLAALGTHVTGVPIEWTASPLVVPCEMLPAVTEGQIAAFLTEAAPLIGAVWKAPRTKHKRPANGSGALPADLARIREVLMTTVPSDDRDEWIAIGAALYHETDGSDEGCAIWNEWSGKSNKYDAEEIPAVWDSFERDSDRNAGFGKIYFLAKNHGYEPPPSVFNDPNFIAAQDAAFAEERQRGKPKTKAEPAAEPAAPGNGAGGSGPAPVIHLPGTNPGAPPPKPQPKPPLAIPEIVVLAGEKRTKCVERALDLLTAANVPFFKQDRRLVRTFRHRMRDAARREILVTGLAEVTETVMLHELVLAARWVKFNGKRQKVPCDPPLEAVQTILGKPDLWPFPTITGLHSTPTLRPDGSLLAAPGYDPATGLYLHELPEMPEIPEQPTRDEARAALQVWLDALDEFPFVTNTDRSVALSGVLTVIGRGAIPGPIFLHLLTSPMSGTGKSYLIDVVVVTATGQRCPVITGTKDTIELDKRLNGMMLKGVSMFSIDNLFVLPTTEMLCQLTERPLIDLRPLGVSDMVRVDNAFTAFATGNNVAAHGDMVRRHLRCELDANVERPAERVFEHADLLTDVMADRGRYIAAALTVLRGYIAAGKPDRPNPLASYREWSDLVRGALIWLGQIDPVESMREAGDDDPDMLATAAMLDAWPAGPGKNEYTSQALIAAGRKNPGLHAALAAVATDRQGAISAEMLGNWLRNHKNRVAGKRKLLRVGSATRPRWTVSVRP
jgi:hypothetical protein